jgi:polyhydroxyalkanoate synthesis regulator phasin
MSDDPEKVQVEIEEVPKEESAAPAPVEEEPTAPVEDVVSAQEVTEVPAPVKSDKERIDELENKVNKLLEILKSSYRQMEINDNEWVWSMDLMGKREEVCDL